MMTTGLKNVSARMFIALMMGVLVGGLGYTALYYHWQWSIETDREGERSLHQARVGASLWRYGFVEEVDPATNRLLVQLENRFEAGAEPLSFVVHVTEDTQIVRQELSRSENVYTGLTPITSGGILDLAPGTRIAMLVENRPEAQALVAQLILFGNPL